MSQPWLKWYPSDWRADPCLRACSLAARGLWIELLGIMHEAEPYGYLLVKGEKPEKATIARLVGVHPNAITPLVTELVTRGVTGVDTHGVLFSRRMVKDHEKALLHKANGAKGGNPTLLKGVIPHIPEARESERKKDSPLPPTGGQKRIRRFPMPPDFVLTSERVEVAKKINLDAHGAFQEFRLHAEDTGRLSANWDVAWVLWCERAAKWAPSKAGRKKIFAWDEDGRQVTHYGDDGLPRYD